MNCPLCNTSTGVVDSRPHKSGIRRRRVCANGHCFTTLEAVSGLVALAKRKINRKPKGDWLDRINKKLAKETAEPAKK